jgi:hypothetical protein
MASPVMTELIGIGVLLPGFDHLKRANAMEDINFRPEDAQGDVGCPINQVQKFL